MIKSVKMAKKKDSEVEVVIKPISRFGGLDNIHVALIALVIALVLLLFVISGSKTISIVNSTNGTVVQLASNYTCNNGNCTQPVHSAAQVKVFAEQVLASYDFVNGSSSLIPYFSDIANATYTYVPKNGEWYVTVPAVSPYSHAKFYESIVVFDSNLSLDFVSIETQKPSQIVQDKLVSEGVISLNNKLSCSTQNPIQVFWFIDPYAPGAIASLNNLTEIENRFGNNVNATVKILFGGATAQVGHEYGLGNAQELGRYLLCASTQSNFGKFSEDLQSAYGGQYLSESVLNPIAQSAGLNMSSLNLCISNSTSLLNRQALLEQYYNITTTPVAIVNCKYLTIPQTVENGICYDNSSVCIAKAS